MFERKAGQRAMTPNLKHRGESKGPPASIVRSFHVRWAVRSAINSSTDGRPAAGSRTIQPPGSKGVHARAGVPTLDNYTPSVSAQKVLHRPYRHAV